MRLLILAAPVLIFLTGCTLTADDPGPSHDLSEAKARWKAARIDSYEIVFRWSCYCIDEYVAPVRLLIIGDELVGGRYVEDDIQLATEDLDRYRTIDGLFDFIDDAISRDAHEVRTAFDSVYGFPSNVWVDYNERTADEEKGFFISSFAIR